MTAAFFLLVLLLAFGMRAHTFFMPHWQGDEGRQVSLAMKYDALGLDALNLERVELRPSVFAGFPGWQFMVAVLDKNSDRGSVNEPPGTHAPLFPVMLAASHRWLAPGQPFVVVQSKPEGDGRDMMFKKYFLRTQAWAVAVPLLSGLLTVVLMFFFIRRLWGVRAAFCAMIFSAVYPGWVAASVQVLPGALTLFLTIAAFYIFYLSCEKKNLLLALVSGIAAGLAILAGQNPVLMVLPGALYLLFKRRRPWIFFWFLSGTVFISAHWFLRIWR